ncbi:DNA glycosylase [Russula earlei]|uniref:DNA glycosylase n=1 Tax=Russula earlei TaxID=71964 RepID=A0ACC0UBH6_9AGAM|nr:DNA glycosylase [Russula earlei]
MKRRRDASTQMTRCISQQSSADAAVTLFKLESPDNGDSAPVPESSVPAARRSTRKRVKVEDEVVKAEEMVYGDGESGVSPPPRTTASQAPAGERKRTRAKSPSRSERILTGTPSASPQKSKAIKQALEKPHPAPVRWRETYDGIKEMRSRFPAPVDTMGCDTAKWKETDPRNKRFATLISLMLSSQTKDEVTDAALGKLRNALGGTLCLDAVLEAEEHLIAEAINKVGFWRRKTQYIKQAARRLRDVFDSDVPKTVDELCSLPGVGPKMAFLCLHAAWDINVGIGVDVHVHRITNRLRWHKPPTKNPEETRLNLQSWLPTEFHKEINHLLVGFGQVICLPVRPRCDVCTLSEQKICPSAQTVVKARAKKSAALNPEGGPKIEIAIEATCSLNLLEEGPGSPSLSAASSLTPDPDDDDA